MLQVFAMLCEGNVHQLVVKRRADLGRHSGLVRIIPIAPEITELPFIVITVVVCCVALCCVDLSFTKGKDGY
jgi:hypothetical protein